MPGRTLLAKIWDQHVIARLSEDTDILHVDRHLLHDLGGSRGLLDLKSRGLKVHNPDLTFATPDHGLARGSTNGGWLLTRLAPVLAATRQLGLFVPCASAIGRRPEQGKKTP